MGPKLVNSPVYNDLGLGSSRPQDLEAEGRGDSMVAAW